MAPRTPTTRNAASIAPRHRGRVRIIGGAWKRRALEVVSVPGLRPTPSRVRETLFDWLAHAYRGNFDGVSALDLFAGSGALGIEAASRGAAPVVLIERDARAVRQLRQAQADFAAPDRVEIRSGDAFELGQRMQRDGRRFDVVFLDPPFDAPRLDETLPLAAALCEDDGFVYVEADRDLSDRPLESMALASYRSGRAGDVFYHLLQRKIRKIEEIDHAGGRVSGDVRPVDPRT